MLTWYLARGAGVAGFAMLSAATALGAFTGRKSLRPEARVVWQSAHRAAALGGVALIVLHIATILADPYAKVGVRGLLPFGSGFRPLAVTLGVVCAYLLVAVSVTGILRSRLAGSAAGARLWRGIHLSSYAAWCAAGWHFYLTGTDAHQGWALAVLGGGTAVVLAGVAGRLTDRDLVTVRTLAPAVTRVQVVATPATTDFRGARR